MKKKHLFFILRIFVYFCGLSFFCTNAFTGLKYMKKEVVFMKWGSGENEVGLLMNGVGDGVTYCIGPRVMDIDGEENIYVMDGKNRRIKVFSPEGKPLRVIVLGKNEGGILSVDEDGEILTEGLHEKKGSYPILIKKNGERVKYKQIEGDFLEGGIIYDMDGNKVQTVNENSDSTTRKHALHLFHDKDYERDTGGKVSVKISQFKNRFFEKYKKNLTSNNLNFNLPKKNGYLIESSIIGMDNAANIYVLWGYGPSVHTDRLYEEYISIFSVDGELIWKIPIQLDMCANSVYPDLFMIDASGNIYQLLNLEDGVHVYKWVKQ